MYNYDRITNLNFRGFAHFNHGYGYNTHADYDTNAPSIEHFLGKTNAYLHYLDHIFAEMIEVISDLLVRMEDLEELRKYKHVPSKLDKTDNTHDYITVKNENRTQADGLAEGLVDTLQQHHLMDTSKLDSIIDNILKNVGIETELVGPNDPGDDTCTTIGSINKYDELRIYWSSLVFSIPRTFTVLAKQIGSKSSFVFPNIVDEPDRHSIAGGEIGQTLCELKGSQTNAQVCYYNSQLFRFENDGGTGANNAWNRVNPNGNSIQPGGRVSFSTSWWENGQNPNYGKGWIHILRITGVSYGLDATQKDFEAMIDRLDNNNYIAFDDYYRNLKYAVSSKQDVLVQMKFLNKLERFYTPLNNFVNPLTSVSSNEYVKWLTYRNSLQERR